LAQPTGTTFWTIVCGVLAIPAAVAVWHFRETVKRLLPPPLRTARWLKTRDIVPSEGTHFTILISDLDGDDNHLSQTKHVEAALRNQRGLEIVLVGPGPKQFESGSRAEYQIRTENQGREILDRHNGDLLIWGEVAQANARLRLQFLPRLEWLEGAHGSYQLEAAELPKNFGDDFSAQLIALALASLSPVTSILTARPGATSNSSWIADVDLLEEQHFRAADARGMTVGDWVAEAAAEQAGRYLVELLRQPVQKLERLLVQDPSGFDRYQIAGLRLALGLAARVIGEQSGDRDWLWKAANVFRVAAYERTSDAPDWAMIQYNLGVTLMRLGQQEKDKILLKDALSAYRKALTKLPRERSPLDWASVQASLATALTEMGEFENAVGIFNDALEEVTRERTPHLWAIIQNNLGGTLYKIGTRAQEGARFEQAIAAFRAALEVRTREDVPIHWATTQNNIGATLLSLGEYEKPPFRLGEHKQHPATNGQDINHLEEAVTTLRDALKVRTRDRLPHQWAKQDPGKSGCGIGCPGRAEEKCGAS
jgi:tetratricopeptide (TPR) repeat protein